jgi:hypothetical protein
MSSKGQEMKVTLNENDILLGRGGALWKNKGNENLRSLASMYMNRYNSVPKFKKIFIAKSIVSKLQHLDPPGRFLRKVTDHEDGSVYWVEASEDKAIEKVSQVLRDLRRKRYRKSPSPPQPSIISTVLPPTPLPYSQIIVPDQSCLMRGRSSPYYRPTWQEYQQKEESLFLIRNREVSCDRHNVNVPFQVNTRPQERNRMCYYEDHQHERELYDNTERKRKYYYQDHQHEKELYDNKEIKRKNYYQDHQHQRESYTQQPQGTKREYYCENHQYQREFYEQMALRRRLHVKESNPVDIVQNSSPPFTKQQWTLISCPYYYS